MHQDEDHTQPELVYYEVSMPNGWVSPNYPDVIAQEQDSRSHSIVDRPENYLLSVQRLSVPGGSIPIKVMEMLFDPGAPTNINNTIYTVQITSSLGASTVITLQWIPEDLLHICPHLLVPGKTIYPECADYYSMHSIQTWCNMVNTALLAAFRQFYAAPLPAPFIDFDGAAELFTLWIPKVQYDVNAIRIFFNQPLKGAFGSTWPMTKVLNTVGNVAYRISTGPTGNNTRTSNQFGAGIFFYTLLQEYSNVNTSDFMSLSNIFVTSDMTTRLQLTPNYIANTVSRSSANQQLNVLTNFAVVGNPRTDISYLPTAQYRQLEILNGSPLYSIGIAVFWQDFVGNQFPLQVPAGTGVNMLLLFERK